MCHRFRLKERLVGISEVLAMAICSISKPFQWGELELELEFKFVLEFEFGWCDSWRGRRQVKLSYQPRLITLWSAAEKLIKLFSIIIYVAHFFACVWHQIAQSEAESGAT